jgi:hypothetical protein
MSSLGSADGLADMGETGRVGGSSPAESARACGRWVGWKQLRRKEAEQACAGAVAATERGSGMWLQTHSPWAGLAYIVVRLITRRLTDSLVKTTTSEKNGGNILAFRDPGCTLNIPAECEALIGSEPDD